MVEALSMVTVDPEPEELASVNPPVNESSDETPPPPPEPQLPKVRSPSPSVWIQSPFDPVVVGRVKVIELAGEPL